MCATLVLGLYDFKEQHSLQPKTFLVSLNRSALKHKCVFIDTLSKYNLIAGNIISWHKKDYKDYKFKYFDNKKIEIDNIDTPTSCLSYSTEYYKGFIDVICESYDDFPDISEKTFKAIAAKKIFLSVGHKGMYKKLQNLGFELYTELFDYSFDEKTNFHERTELAIKQIKKYENMNYNNMTKKVYSKIEKNYINFLRIAHSVPNEFIEFINKYDIEYYSKLFEYFRKAKKVY